MASSTSPQSTPPPASDGTTGVYGITTAAQLAGMSVQALRLYERKGLLEPTRTSGGTRRYSDSDIARLRRISVLQQRNTALTDTNKALRAGDDNAAHRARDRRPPARHDTGTTPDSDDKAGRRRSDRSGR